MRQRKSKSTIPFIAWRFYWVLAFIFIISVGLMIRIMDLTLIRQPFLQKEGNTRAVRVINTPAFRGMIADRYGYPLAVSTKVYSLWLNPNEFKPSVRALQSLSQFIGSKPQFITQLLIKNQGKHRGFVYLKRSLAPEVTTAIKALAIPGLYTQEEYRRYYPEGEVTAHLIGFTNVDDQGIEGLELAYNAWLQGEKGKRRVIKDRLGRVIADVQLLQEQKRGSDLELSIDRRIQYLAYRALLNGVNENQESYECLHNLYSFGLNCYSLRAIVNACR